MMRERCRNKAADGGDMRWLVIFREAKLTSPPCSCTIDVDISRAVTRRELESPSDTTCCVSQHSQRNGVWAALMNGGANLKSLV
jgi:hypothetical protein